MVEGIQNLFDLTDRCFASHRHEPADPGFFTGPERVHLVLTSYAKGEPVESQGDISSGMPPQTLVWVVEVHAKAIHWDS
jgi:hypothetical protein